MKKNIYAYFLQNKWLTLSTVLLILFASAFAQLTPYIQGLIVDNAIEAHNQTALVNLILVFVSILFLDAFAKMFLSIFMTNYGYNVAGKIRKDIFAKTINRPLDFFESNQNGDILQRTNYYVYNIGSYISSTLSNLAIEVGRVVIIFTFMLVLNYKLALILFGLYFFAFFIIKIFTKKLNRLGKEVKSCDLHRSALILENISGMETYLAYNDNFDYFSNYKQVNGQYDKLRTKYYFIYNTLKPLIDFIVSLGTVLIYHLTFNGIIGVFEIGIVVAMLTYANRIIEPMQNISSGIASMSESRSVAEKVFSLDNEEYKQEKLCLNYEKINIKCENVFYQNTLNGTNISGLNLNIPFGEKLLVIGRYGLGKTSFANLLSGLYKTKNGSIYFNEININNICKKNINEMISVASDNVGIFNGTIYQNIRFAKPSATDDEIKNAIKKSGLTNFVKSLKYKTNTLINEKSVSEGDKQLIAFARLILKNTPIIIIDEVSRDLSAKEQKQFLNNLEEFCKNKTLIYISQNANVNFPFTKKVWFKKLNKYN